MAQNWVFLQHDAAHTFPINAFHRSYVQLGRVTNNMFNHFGVRVTRLDYFTVKL
jgi:hypothetical protein